MSFKRPDDGEAFVIYEVFANGTFFMNREWNNNLGLLWWSR